MSPNAWGVERDKELKRMPICVKGKPHVFQQSHIDPSVWSVVRGTCASEEVVPPKPRQGSKGCTPEGVGPETRQTFDSNNTEVLG